MIFINIALLLACSVLTIIIYDKNKQLKEKDECIELVREFEEQERSRYRRLKKQIERYELQQVTVSIDPLFLPYPARKITSDGIKSIKMSEEGLLKEKMISVLRAHIDEYGEFLIDHENGSKLKVFIAKRKDKISYSGNRNEVAYRFKN